MAYRSLFITHWWLCVFALLLAACDMPVINTDREPKVPYKHERALGYMAFSEDQDAPKVEVYKVHKGYALKSNMHEGENHKTHFVVSKNKEYKWFTGLQWRYEF